MKEPRDFHQDLRNEIHAAQDRRAAYTRQKLAFVTGLLGVGSISLQRFGTFPLLYVAPLAALAYDFYILGENFGIRRAGTFLLKSPGAPDDEALWERTVRQHRDLFAMIGGPLSTLLTLFAAAIVLFPSQGSYARFWIWIGVTLLVLNAVHWIDRTRHNHLKAFEALIEKERAIMAASREGTRVSVPSTYPPQREPEPGGPSEESIRDAMNAAWRDHHHARDQTWKALQMEAVLAVGMIGVDAGLSNSRATLGAGILTLLAAIFGMGITLHHRRVEIRKLTHVMGCEEALRLRHPKLIWGVWEPDPVRVYDAFRVWRTNTALFLLRMHLSVAAFAILYLWFGYSGPGAGFVRGGSVALLAVAMVVLELAARHDEKKEKRRNEEAEIAWAASAAGKAQAPPAAPEVPAALPSDGGRADSREEAKPAPGD